MVKEGQKRDSPNADSPDRDSRSAPDHSSIISVKKRLSLYEITLWGRDFVSVVRIRESRYYFSGHWKLSVGVRIREVSVPRGSTVFFSTTNHHVNGLNPGVISKVG